MLEGEADVARGYWQREAQNREIVKRWNDLDRPLITNQKNLGRVDEGRFLEKFTTLLNDHGFVFNKRHMLAFHTGLKCADISPLVVLAGISGTGKACCPSYMPLHWE